MCECELFVGSTSDNAMGMKTIFGVNSKMLLRMEGDVRMTHRQRRGYRITVTDTVHSVLFIQNFTKDCLQTNETRYNDLKTAAAEMLSSQHSRPKKRKNNKRPPFFLNKNGNWKLFRIDITNRGKKRGFEVKQKSPLINVKHAAKWLQLNVLNKQAHSKCVLLFSEMFYCKLIVSSAFQIVCHRI